ncbi:MAG: ATP-binding protein [Sandaracinaceae bacterium]|nr:ATP-binding protein [Sandaracinaceae bacterium]
MDEADRQRRWFEVADEGWRRLSAARPLGRLLLEALQNAFDEAAPLVTVTLSPERVVVEDDGPGGIVDERLVYTIFLSDKPDDPTRRGRMGRGLKELLASMDRARVETVGRTVTFDEAGRTIEDNPRERGTRLVLERGFDDGALSEARALLGLCIPPRGTRLLIDGRAVRRPRSVLALSGCSLETVVVADGVERAALGQTTLSVFAPRKGEAPHLFEMGLPIEPWNVPWHVDVAQRVPLKEGRDSVPDRYKLAVKAALLEAMIHSYLDRSDLRGDWVHDVIAAWPLSSSLLDAYVSRVFPRGSVLGGTSRANDRARQLGAHIIDAAGISHGAYVSLARVLETSDDYVRRRSREFGGEDVEPDEAQRRFADAVRWIARAAAGRVVRVRFFARDPSDAGLLEDAVTDVERREIAFNVRGPLRFEDILEPMTLGVVLHEIAHLETPEHDHRFIDRLQHLAGKTARLLAEGGPELAAKLRAGDPDRGGREPRE